jgi:glutamine---fructose-6-phosphate transaminase (isomerizing)
MCGIVACISDDKCVDMLYNGLIQLKNRGYDSAGICTLQNNKFITHKYASTQTTNAYTKLQQTLNVHNKSTIGISHTRWATHGGKTDENSHPHTSMNNIFSVVHNGIIENYKEIKQMLISYNYKFVSQTDTEVIVQLLDYLYLLYKDTKSICEIIRELNNMLKGTWGLAILCSEHPNTLFCTRQGSPILIGHDSSNALIVSEKSGFCNKVQQYIVLNNLDICQITKVNSNIQITTSVQYTSLELDKNTECLTHEPYPHWTIKEIYEQPESSFNAINMGGRILNNSEVKLGGLQEHINELKSIDNLLLLGCGTSYNAGYHGMYFLKDLCKFNTVQLFDGAEFNSNDIPKYGKTALLFISQSGETKDLHRCIEIGKNHNLFLLGIVNVVDSLIAREVYCGCYLNAGREVGVASTKAYTSQVIVLSLISIWFAQIHNININKRIKYIHDILQLSNDIKHTLEYTDEKIDQLIQSVFFKTTNCFLLGKGKSEPVAREASLKIKEITYIHSEGYSTSSLKHGPFALLDETFPVIIISPDDINYSKSENAYEEIKSRNAPIIFITNKKNQIDKHNVIYIKTNETFNDLLCLLPLQLLAYKLAINRNINPDVPRNLAKVVTVE